MSEKILVVLGVKYKRKEWARIVRLWNAVPNEVVVKYPKTYAKFQKTLLDADRIAEEAEKGKL